MRFLAGVAGETIGPAADAHAHLRHHPLDFSFGARSLPGVRCGQPPEFLATAEQVLDGRGGAGDHARCGGVGGGERAVFGERAVEFDRQPRAIVLHYGKLFVGVGAARVVAATHVYRRLETVDRLPHAANCLIQIRGAHVRPSVAPTNLRDALS